MEKLDDDGQGEGRGCDECGSSGRCHPSCDLWVEPPDAIADFVRSLYGETK